MYDRARSPRAAHFTVAAALAFLFGGRIAAAAPAGWYVGAGVGESRIYDTSACSKVNGTMDPGYSCNEKTTDTATRLFVGYRFRHHWSAETSYIDFGQFSAAASGTESGVPATASVVLKARGVGVNVNGILPVTNAFGVVGRIGVVRWHTTESSSISALGMSTTEEKSATGVSVSFGAGVKYDFTPDMRGRVELVRYPDTTGRSQIDVLLVSVAYHLG